MKQLLIETNNFNPVNSYTILNETVAGGKNHLIVEGILATAEVKNGNGRYYSKALWERELEKYADSIRNRRAIGELDHPESQVVNLKNVSHNIESIRWEGDQVIGKIKILNTTSGNILRALIEEGIQVGVSSRGMGSLEEIDGVLEVQDDFELLCWDFVSTPSNPGSYMSVLQEGKTSRTYDYTNVNAIITEILCSQGECPVF